MSDDSTTDTGAAAATQDDIAAAGAAISRAIQGVARKIAATTDPQQKQELRQTLSDLEDQKAQLTFSNLSRAAEAVSAAAASLQAVTDGARTDPADVLLSEALDGLRGVAERLA